jgi:hypothetical protein
MSSVWSSEIHLDMFSFNRSSSTALSSTISHNDSIPHRLLFPRKDAPANEVPVLVHAFFKRRCSLMGNMIHCKTFLRDFANADPFLLYVLFST